MKTAVTQQRSGAGNSSPSATTSALLQRKCSCGAGAGPSGECQQCQEEKLQRKSTGRRAPELAPPSVHRVLQSSGQPLDEGVRRPMEQRLGHDFSKVRVHTDAPAAASARSVSARAYTVGEKIVFGRGEYRPQTPEGRGVLAHELAHVTQQRPLGRGSSTPERLPVAPDHGPDERQAEEQGAQLGKKAPEPAAPTGKPSARGQRAHPAAVQRLTAGEWLARFFGGGTFSEQQLQDYLTYLDDKKKPMDTMASDNMAREVVGHWAKGDANYILSVERKILLIREMLLGYTGDDDENAILTLLRGATSHELARIFSEVGKDKLDGAFQGAEQDALDELAKNRQTAIQGPQEDTSGETFAGKEIVALQKRFKSNAEATNRLNCILIVREMAPKLFAADPTLAASVKAELGKLKGLKLKMTEVGKVMAQLGLATQSAKIKFDGANGVKEPTAMKQSAWDTIMGMVGNQDGWHVFGMAVFNGYHSVTVLVEKRGNSVQVYWADQWSIDPGDDFHQASGSESGFRRYEKAGFDEFINEKTNEWWNDKNAEGKQWAATLHIWKFRSALSAPSGSTPTSTPSNSGGGNP
ncbi:MAG: DUF4157 domain-containing protein [Acidobacteriota bacterium]|nr:DUF4157 domain-containing protein [Acidobacteriota bacterium]